jgi:hypothetical protein
MIDQHLFELGCYLDDVQFCSRRLGMAQRRIARALRNPLGEGAKLTLRTACRTLATQRILVAEIAKLYSDDDASRKILH